MPKAVRQRAPAAKEQSLVRWSLTAALPRWLVESPRAETEEAEPARTPGQRTQTVDFLTRRTRQTQVEPGAAWRRLPYSEV